jgi:rfaE bifunctional protein kinase chain/domain
MKAARFAEITARYSSLRIGLVGDFFLDRYLEIDPAKAEISIETGLPVHNVVNVRAQPGAAGTILNNLVALGIGEITPVGFCGDDGEGYELRRALAALPGVNLADFLTTTARRTFVYCKPLILQHAAFAQELSRFDSKNWTATPRELQHDLASRVRALSERVDVLILMDQVDIAETGVVTPLMRQTAHNAAQKRPELFVLADSRRGLSDYPPLGFKMNATELSRMTGAAVFEIEGVLEQAAALANYNHQPVFVTLAERGIVGALPGGSAEHVPGLPVRGPIDVVGAGDAVTANLAAALAAGAELAEAMELAMTAASLVIHQLGTTGSASVQQIRGSMEL